MATDMTVSTTILRQLGGKRFIAMTGAKDFVGSDNALTMSLSSRLTRNQVNKVRITLTANDDYMIETFNLRGVKLTPIDKQEGVYVDTLRKFFKALTGLDTYL